MRELLNHINLLIFLILCARTKEDLCPTNQISIKPLGTTCKSIDDILENPELSIETNDLLYLAANNRGIIEKDNYRLEILKLNDERLQSHNIKKSKLFIPYSCMKSMEEDEKIKLDNSTGIIILAYNRNIMNKNNLPQIFFTIRHNSEGSQTKFMNSKTFDFSLCHVEPILFEEEINITNLTYDYDDNTTINIDQIMYAKKKKIDLFDPHSDFFDDICFKFTSEINTDVTLEQRLEEYYQNITLCNESLGSHYMEFNYSNTDKKFVYRCAYGFYKSEEEKQSYIDDIDSKMKFLLKTSNIKVITCFAQLLNVKNFIKNYGGLICLFVIFVQLILYIDYCVKGIKPLQDKVDKLFASAGKKKKTYKGKRYITSIITSDGEEKGDTEGRLKIKNNEQVNDEIQEVKSIETINLEDQKVEKAENAEKAKKGKKKKKKKKTKKITIEPSNPPKKKSAKNGGDTNTNGNGVINGLDNDKYNGPYKNAHNDNLNGDNDAALILFQESSEFDLKYYEDVLTKTFNYYGVPLSKMNEPVIMDEIAENYDFNDDEINELPYEKALDCDDRTFCEYYCGLLYIGHILFNVFCRCDDYNLFSLKFGLLILLFPINLTYNIFFYTSEEIKITHVKKLSDLSTLTNSLLHSVLSSIFSMVTLILLKFLCLTHNSIRGLRRITNIKKAKEKSKSVLRCVKIRIFVYYIISMLFLLVFGYYVACFCSVYVNTQIELIESMFVSWFLSLLYPFGIYFVTTILRLLSLKCEKKFCYRINQIMQFI